MKLSELYLALTEIVTTFPGDMEVLLHYEQSAMEDGFSKNTSEGISDIRLIDDWALPGHSLVHDEGRLPKTLVIFYDNHFKLDSSTEEA